MRNAPNLTEADILAEVVAPDRPGLSPETARHILTMKLSKEATKQVRRFLQKNNRGTITAGERVTLEKYLRVGQFLDLLRAKADLSVRQPAETL